MSVSVAQKMSHALARLNAMKKWQDDEIVKANELSWARSPQKEQKFYKQIREQKRIILQKISLIGAICVQNHLPAGDPCWIAKMICSYN